MIDTAELSAALRRELVRPVEVGALTVPDGSANAHYRVVGADGRAYFVKVYARDSCFRTEGATLAGLAGTCDWLIAPVGAGTLDAGTGWRAFPFVELRPVTGTPETAAVAARLLAEVHATPAPAIDRAAGAADALDAKLRELTPWPDVRDRCVALRDRWRARYAGQPAAAAAPVLLAGDFGFRNMYRSPEGYLLLDFELAAIGDAHWDLGKAWDRELADPACREAFLAAYGAATGRPGWPEPATLLLTRIAAAAAIFPYAAGVGDDDFFAHGRTMLSVLETELADGRAHAR